MSSSTKKHLICKNVSSLDCRSEPHHSELGSRLNVVKIMRKSKRPLVIQVLPKNRGMVVSVAFGNA